MEHKKYYGVIPPIITPIDEHENVDEEGFRALLEHCIRGGLHGVFVAGSNGETMALTQEQRNRAISIAIDQCRDRVPVMAGTMDSSTRRVIDNIKALEQMGGRCAVVTSIFYDRHTSQSETIRHFEKIAENTNVDLIIYNIPKFTGLALTPDTVRTIAQIPAVKGYKDSAGDLTGFLKLMPEYQNNPDFSMLQGVTGLAVGSLLMGADGFVPSVAPLFPEIFVEAYEAGRSGEAAIAQKYNVLLAETSKILGMCKNDTAANKFALSTLGYTDKRVIWPQDTCSTQEEHNILRQIERIKGLYAELKGTR